MQQAGTPSTPPPERDDRFPPGIPFIVGNEAAERFSFYGMRQILYVYLTALFIGFVAESAVNPEALADAKVKATQWVHLFMAGVYLTPLIGAVLADRLLGKYKVIFWVSMIYVFGHGMLAIGGRLAELGILDRAEMAFVIGLGLIAVGAGGIKPCVSAHVGDQFSSRNKHLVEKIYQIFYFTINFGSFFASLLMPLLYRKYGPEIAFGVPGILMALATVFFWMGRKRYNIPPPNPGGKLGAFDFVASTLMLAPLIIAVYIASEESARIVQTVSEHGWGSLGSELGQVAAHYWGLAAIGAASLVAGLALAQFRQQIKEDHGFMAVTIHALLSRSRRLAGEGFWGPARRHYGGEVVEGPIAVLRIIVVFSMVTVFWALFDQHSSTWIEQAKQMDLVVNVPSILWDYWIFPGTLVSALLGAVLLILYVSNRPAGKRTIAACAAVVGLWGLGTLVAQLTIGGMQRIEMLPAQIAALNPLLVMIIIPLLSVLVYGPLAKAGRPLSPLRRMTIGMFVAAFSFVAVALIQWRIEQVGPGQVHVLWQLIPYVIITSAEVLVSITGLEFAYTQAPRAMKSTIVSFWLLTVTFGNILVAFLAPLQKLSLTTFFWMFAGLMAAAAVVFALLASTYKGKTYMQS